MTDEAPDPKILRHLKEMLGLINPWDGKVLHVNSSYNDLYFCYIRFYDKFGEKTFYPNEMTSLTQLDRAIRQLPGREKNILLQERLRKYYGRAIYP